MSNHRLTSAVAPANCVIWQPTGALPFRGVISSESPQILAAAAALFEPWLVRPTSQSAPETCLAETRLARWSVEAEPNSDLELWRVPGQGDWRNLSAAELLRRIEYDAVWQLVMGLGADFLGFHGALLCKNGRAVLLLGAKESGKSTLSSALWQDGWELLCDDYVLIDRALRVHAIARRVSLRASSRALLGGELWAELAALPDSLTTTYGLLFHPHQLAGQAPRRTGPAALSAIFFLQGENNENNVENRSDRPALRKILPVRAALRVLSYSALLLATLPPGASNSAATMEEATETATCPEQWFGLLPRVTPLVEAVPCFDLARDALPRMIERIEAVVQ